MGKIWTGSCKESCKDSQQIGMDFFEEQSTFVCWPYNRIEHYAEGFVNLNTIF